MPFLDRARRVWLATRSGAVADIDVRFRPTHVPETARTSRPGCSGCERWTDHRQASGPTAAARAQSDRLNPATAARADRLAPAARGAGGFDRARNDRRSTMTLRIFVPGLH